MVLIRVAKLSLQLGALIKSFKVFNLAGSTCRYLMNNMIIILIIQSYFLILKSKITTVFRTRLKYINTYHSNLSFPSSIIVLKYDLAFIQSTNEVSKPFVPTSRLYVAKQIRQKYLKFQKLSQILQNSSSYISYLMIQEI